MTVPDSTPPARQFSVGALIGGLALSLIVGAIGAFIAGLISMSQESRAIAFFAGLTPGAIFVIIGALLKKQGFAQGLIIGGCVIGLIGGLCGTSLVGTSFH